MSDYKYPKLVRKPDPPLEYRGSIDVSILKTKTNLILYNAHLI